MKARNRIYRWLVALWLLIGAQTVGAYQPATPPEYQFQSTSAMAPMVEVTVYEPGCSSPAPSPKTARKSFWDGEPDDDELGQVNTPLGDIPCLLFALFALAYIAAKRVKE